MWKTIIESEDLLTYEKKAKDSRIIIEARLNKDKTWNVFKIYYNGKENQYTESFKVITKEEAKELVNSLKSKDILSKQQIEEIKKSQQKNVSVQIKRIFKEYNIEKWGFNVNYEKIQNIAFIRETDVVDIDLFMHEKYRAIHQNVAGELLNTLGLASYEIDIHKEIYFFNEKTCDTIKSKKQGFYVGKIEMGFDLKEE